MKKHRTTGVKRARMRWARKFATLSPMEIYGLIAVCFLLLLSAVGPHITPHPVEKPNPAARLLPPNSIHWLGTDENGMDVLSRIMAAPRVDVSVAFLAISIAVAIGTPLGVFAGFFEGSKRKIFAIAGETILRLLDVIQAFPVFVLAMVLVAVRGATTENIIIAVEFVNMPTFLRISRAEILSLRQRPYTEAAKSIGAKDIHIAFKHLLPNALPPLIAQVSVTMGFAILLTAGLSFIGAGVQPPTPELGGMISTGARMMIIGYWWPSLFPGVALGLIVFSFAAGGQALGRLLEPHGTDAEGTAARSDNAKSEPASENLDSSLYRRENNSFTLKEEKNYCDVDRNHCMDSKIHEVNRPSECLLVVENLSTEFEAAGTTIRVLDNISLWVAPGETFGIVGESGSGKSVLIRSILRLLPENGKVVNGTVNFRGKSLLDMTSEELRKIRAVNIAPILPNAKNQLSPVTRIADLLTMVYKAHAHGDRKTVYDKSVEALRMVGIQDPEQRLRAYPHELSGGMAQRVCIALALLHSPELVIADEPTTGLDVTVQRQVLDQMISAAKQRGAAQLIVTRDLGIVAQYCQRLAVMKGGRIVETGYTEDVFHEPKHPYTNQLLAAVQDSFMSSTEKVVTV